MLTLINIKIGIEKSPQSDINSQKAWTRYSVELSSSQQPNVRYSKIVIFSSVILYLILEILTKGIQ